MRCYFLRNNRIEGVTFLKTASDDQLIREAEALFLEWTARQQFDGLEVWDGDRFVYRRVGSEPVRKSR